MKRVNNERLIYRLSVIIIVLATIASVGGLVLPNLYRDNAMYTTVWKANDIITLFLVVPMMVVSILKTKEGSAKSLLLWTGLLAYMMYNYAFYLFGAAFNWFFLLYLAIFSICIYALFIRLASLNVLDIANRFSVRTPRKAIALFLLLIAAPLAIFEIAQCVRFIIYDQLPYAPTLIFALDLTLVIPNTVLAAILLLRNKPWGYILTAIMLVKSFAYGAVLTLATAMVAGFHLRAIEDPLMLFYVFVMIGGGFALVVFLRHLNVRPKIICYVTLYSSFHHYGRWFHPFNRLRKWYRHVVREKLDAVHDHL